MRNTTVLLIAGLVLLMGVASLSGANVAVPSGSTNPSDQCAQMNNAFAPAARCIQVTAGTSIYYVYALSTNLNSGQACKVHAAAPSGSLPSIGVYQEGNSVAGLQTASDTKITGTCTPWTGP